MKCHFVQQQQKKKHRHVSYKDATKMQRTIGMFFAEKFREVLGNQSITENLEKEIDN